MRGKAVFVDVDGTLITDLGVVPDSARRAVRTARANGHRVFLCTGRSLSELWAEIVDIGFDGVIAAAGGYVEHAGRVLAHASIPVDQVLRVVEFFDTHGGEYFLETNSGLYGSPGIRARMHELIFAGVRDDDILAELERGFGPFLDHVIVGADPARDDINKISFLDSQASLDEIRAEFSDTFDVIPATVPMFGPNSGELSIRGITKATAIQVLTDHLGIDPADTIAFGDGHNDLEMLAHVAVGVAMGNAIPELKAVADAITGPVDADGLYAGFAAHGLLSPVPGGPAA